MSKIGFFDLPLEVRQMVYSNLIPEELTLTYPLANCRPPQGTTFAQVCAADPSLHDELTTWGARACTLLKILVSTNTPLPNVSDIHHTSSIEIVIDYYDRTCRDSSVAQLRERITGLVAILSKCKGLKDLTISFRDDIVYWDEYRRPRLQHEYWRTRPHFNKGATWQSKDRDSVLKTLDSSNVPIVEYLLTPFITMPVIESAEVTTIEELRTTTEFQFDNKYMLDLKAALGIWLMGYREFPFNELRKQPGGKLWEIWMFWHLSEPKNRTLSETESWLRRWGWRY